MINVKFVFIIYLTLLYFNVLFLKLVLLQLKDFLKTSLL